MKGEDFKPRDRRAETEDLAALIDHKKTVMRAVVEEIKTPFNVVLSGLVALETGEGTSPQALETIKDMKAACQEAVETIGDFIAFERLDSDLGDVDRKETNFYALVAKCLRSFQLQSKTDKIELKFISDEEGAPANVAVEESKMNQVLRSLISTAMK
jgi:signal transduction histidine kinase